MPPDYTGQAQRNAMQCVAQDLEHSRVALSSPTDISESRFGDFRLKRQAAKAGHLKADQEAAV